MFFKNLKLIKPSQKGNANEKVKSIWAVRVKIYGISPLKFKIKTKENRLSKMLILPFLFLFGIDEASSLSNKLLIFLVRFNDRVGRIKILRVKGTDAEIRRIKKFRFRNPPRGSKEENRLIIMFKI